MDCMKKKIHIVLMWCLIPNSILCIETKNSAEQNNGVSSQENDKEDMWNVFSDSSTMQDGVPTINFNTPPKPSRFQVLMRRIGIPIFMRYVQAYTWVRRWVYWVQMRVRSVVVRNKAPSQGLTNSGCKH